MSFLFGSKAVTQVKQCVNSAKATNELINNMFLLHYINSKDPERTYTVDDQQIILNAIIQRKTNYMNELPLTMRTTENYVYILTKRPELIKDVPDENIELILYKTAVENDSSTIKYVNVNLLGECDREDIYKLYLLAVKDDYNNYPLVPEEYCDSSLVHSMVRANNLVCRRYGYHNTVSNAKLQLIENTLTKSERSMYYFLIDTDTAKNNAFSMDGLIGPPISIRISETLMNDKIIKLLCKNNNEIFDII